MCIRDSVVCDRSSQPKRSEKGERETKEETSPNQARLLPARRVHADGLNVSHGGARSATDGKRAAPCSGKHSELCDQVFQYAAQGACVRCAQCVQSNEYHRPASAVERQPMADDKHIHGVRQRDTYLPDPIRQRAQRIPIPRTRSAHRQRVRHLRVRFPDVFLVT